MVIRGKSRGNGKQLGTYLLSQRDNDHKPQVLQMRGFADRDPRHALINSALDVATVSKSNKPFYHGILNPREGEATSMNPEQWGFAADLMEQAMKYEGLPRLIVLHEKQGRVHAHVVWLRYDYMTGKLRPDAYNFYKHNTARATIEQTFGHERTNDRRDRSKEPSHKEQLTQLWQDSQSAADFIEQAQAAGYEIGQGLANRPYRVITPEGMSLDLVRQLKGCRKRDVQTRFKGHDLATEAQALKQAQQRAQMRRQLHEQQRSTDVFEQLRERNRRGALLQDFKENSANPSSDDNRDIFEQLKEQQTNQNRRWDKSLEL